MREIRTYRKVRETEADRKYGVMVPLGTPIRVSQDAGEGDMQMEGFERVHPVRDTEAEIAEANRKRQNGQTLTEREWMLVQYDNQSSCTCGSSACSGPAPNGGAA